MALASHHEAHSVVELSLSPLFHYQYSSLFKAIDQSALADPALFEGQLLPLLLGLTRQEEQQPYALLQTDTTTLVKPHSPTLAERTYVLHPNNAIAGNRPISIGYEFSFVNLAPGPDQWTLPLLAQRVRPDQTASDCAIEQLDVLMPQLAPYLRGRLLVNTLDSSYGKASYLARAYPHERLINLVRMRKGMQVWKCARCRGHRGTPKVYGERFYLLHQSRHHRYTHNRTRERCTSFQPALGEQPPDRYTTLEVTAGNGRGLLVHLWRYNDLLIRTKDGHNMKDKPFDVLIAKVYDAHAGNSVFRDPFFIAIAGQERRQISAEMAYHLYRRRYDIEPYFRFAKQRLLLDRFQSPDRAHLENWLRIVQLASWLLYAACEEVDFRPRKWESAVPRNLRRSMAQARRAAQGLFLTFDPGLFKPPKTKKGNGRLPGSTLPARARFKVCSKTTTGARANQRYKRKRRKGS